MRPTGHLRIGYYVNPQTGERTNVLQQWWAYENDKVTDSAPTWPDTGMWSDVPTFALPWDTPTRGGPLRPAQRTVEKP